MENSAASQLPEVDSLPDGFVESSAESVASPIPTFEQENSRRDQEEDSGPLRAVEACEVKSEKTEKMRTFPVLLTEKDGLDSVAQSVKVPCHGSLEEKNAVMGMPKSADSVPEAAVRLESELSGHSSNGKEQDGVKLENTEKSTISRPKKLSLPESTELLKNKKQEASEVKRKNAKRSIKSEKEFLEFTLKYQQVIAERDSAIAVRDKLESLCRELQRQNKTLMDECKRVSTEGQTLRLDLSNRFHDAIKDVSSRLEEQKVECLSQFKENEMLRSKLKELADQYALSEQQFIQKLKQKSLELQLAELKIQQSEEKLVQEQSQIKLYAEQVSQLLATEKSLRSQLTSDGDKFEQFQDALLKSSEVFETFKQEIDKMSKSIKELKKENAFLKSKCDKSDVTLIELVEEREHTKKRVDKLKSQKVQLESLCRSLQAERKQFSTATESHASAPS